MPSNFLHGARIGLVPSLALYLPDGRIRDVSKTRLDKIYEVYENTGLDYVLVLGEIQSEARRSYLLGRGIPEKVLLTTQKGFSTLSELYYGKVLLQEKVIWESVTDSRIATQRIYWLRTLLDAYALSYKNPQIEPANDSRKLNAKLEEILVELLKLPIDSSIFIFPHGRENPLNYEEKVKTKLRLLEFRRITRTLFKIKE